jgi:DNA/RNA endonuclease G (NUC1)
MTIMLAGSVSFAIPGVMPGAEAANQYLWVSVEDSGANKFYGGQVLEIVVTDPAINRLDEAYGMPDVTITVRKLSWHRVSMVLGMLTLLMARKQPLSMLCIQK